MAYIILGNNEFKTLKQISLAIKMDIDKAKLISENPTKNKVSFDFYWVSDVTHQKKFSPYRGMKAF